MALFQRDLYSIKAGTVAFSGTGNRTVTFTGVGGGLAANDGAGNIISNFGKGAILRVGANIAFVATVLTTTTLTLAHDTVMSGSGQAYELYAATADESLIAGLIQRAVTLGAPDNPFMNLVWDDGVNRMRFVTDTGLIKAFVGPTKTGAAETANTLGFSLNPTTGAFNFSIIASDIAFTPTGAVVATNVQAAIAEVDSKKLPKAGPATFTGDLTVTGNNPVTGNMSVGGTATIPRLSGPVIITNGRLELNAPANESTHRKFVMSTSGSWRWANTITNGTESGSNVGADYRIDSYSDAGTWMATPFEIVRYSGCVRTPLQPEIRLSGTGSGAGTIPVGEILTSSRFSATFARGCTWNGANGRVTVPHSGRYLISLLAIAEISNTYANFTIDLSVNGSYVGPMTSDYQSMTGRILVSPPRTRILNLAASDYISLQVPSWQTAGIRVDNLHANNFQFNVHYLG